MRNIFMPLQTKALWIEDLDNAGDQTLATQHIQAIGANMVCIRTNSPLLVGWLPALKQMQLKVYGWRWPYVVAGYKNHAYAPEESKFVAEQLIPAGLDGYIMDIESDESHSPHDWDRTDVGDLTQLATDYCKVIKDAARNCGRPFTIGLTSHARGFSNYPKIPWAPFLAITDVLYPQTYWRFYDDKKQKCVDENADPVTHKGAGTPAQAVLNGFTDYGSKNKPIIPVSGEMVCSTAQEMTTFGALIAARGITEGHFYVSKPTVDATVLAAIKIL
jgi:hypothetical protein